MPSESVGLAGALFLYPDRVTIVVGRYQSTHARHPQGRLADSAIAGSPGSSSPSSSSWGPRITVPLAARGA
jgi:hypothetical protein